MNSNLANQNNYNSTSIGTESSNFNQQQGGFIWSNGCSNNDKKALLAAKQQNFHVVKFMIENDMITNYGACDNDYKTLLHYLVSYKEFHDCIKLIIQKCDVKQFINKQDNDGNTALFLAVKHQNYKIADLLMKNGGDKTIKNNRNQWIDTEVCETESEGSFFFSENNPNEIVLTHSDTTNSSVNEILNKFLKTKSQPSVTYDTISPNAFKELETTEKKQSIIKEDTVDSVGSLSNIKDTDEFLDMLMNRYVTKIDASFGGSVEYTDDTINSEKYLDQIINKEIKGNTMIGGAATRTGYRTLNIEAASYNSEDFDNEDYQNDFVDGEYSSEEEYENSVEENFEDFHGDFETSNEQMIDEDLEDELSGGSSEEYDVTSEDIEAYENEDNILKHDKKMNGLKRMIARQQDDHHKRVVDDIKKILATDDMKMVYRVKTTIYRDEILKKKPDLKSPLDKAIELEKIVSDDKKGPALVKKIAKSIEKLNKEHDKLLEKIVKLAKTDEQTARLYKAAIYLKAKQESKADDSPLKIVAKAIKMVTADALKQIDPKKVSEDIQAWKQKKNLRKRKRKHKPQQQSPEQQSPEQQSPEQQSPEQGYSETSYEDLEYNYSPEQNEHSIMESSTSQSHINTINQMDNVSETSGASKNYQNDTFGSISESNTSNMHMDTINNINDSETSYEQNNNQQHNNQQYNINDIFGYDIATETSPLY